MAFPTTNLFARYEAKDETYNDLDTVTTTTDQSSNSYDLVNPAGDNDPEYRTNILNGHAVYRYDGSNTEGHRSTSPNLTAQSAFTCCVVAATTSEGSSRTWVSTVYDSTDEIFGVTEGVTASEWGSYTNTTLGLVQEATSGVDTTQFAVITVVFGSGSAEMFLDGTSQGSTSVTGNLDVQSIMIGDGAEVNQHFTGDIALVAYWDKALDATERGDLHSYVQDTYGITVSDYNATSGMQLVGGAGLVG